MENILEINGLSVSFEIYAGGLDKSVLNVISDLRLEARPGEITAIAGSSGSGKSLLASAVLGILPSNAVMSGEILYKGQALTAERQKQLRGTEIALVPQSVAFLDPLMKAGAQADGHKNPKPTEKRNAIFRRLGLDESAAKFYPFQLSGGMARRVLVSTALISDAELIIADEPTPGMSTDQAVESLKMFRELADSGKAVVIITHDIDLAFGIADRVSVFYAGTTVETAPASDFRDGQLRHPYSRALWEALPQNGFKPIPGIQPYAGELPNGCVFAPRCPYRTAECESSMPPVQKLRGGEVRCFYAT